MSTTAHSADITGLLVALSDGTETARARLIEAVYEELRLRFSWTSLRALFEGALARPFEEARKTVSERATAKVNN